MKKKKKRIRFIDFLLVIIIIVGILIASYPMITQIYYRSKANKEIESFKKSAYQLKEDDIDKRILLAQAYNDSLLNGKTADDIEDPYTDLQKDGIREYARMLEVNEKLGYIRIPKIAQEIPIYAGTTETVLQKGAGHLEGTSLPIGGPNTHTVITAHSGLPTARLFTDLEELEVGDRFYIINLKETLAYQVDQIKVVEPDDFSNLLVNMGEDQATLLTCTPYMVNSHRLLVRGSRIDYISQVERHDIEVGETDQRYKLMFIAALVLLLIILIVLIISRRRYKKLRRELQDIKSQVVDDNEKEKNTD